VVSGPECKTRRYSTPIAAKPEISTGHVI
jgi:hypothetical protein